MPSPPSRAANRHRGPTSKPTTQRGAAPGEALEGIRGITLAVLNCLQHDDAPLQRHPQVRESASSRQPLALHRKSVLAEHGQGRAPTGDGWTRLRPGCRSCSPAGLQSHSPPFAGAHRSPIPWTPEEPPSAFAMTTVHGAGAPCETHASPLRTLWHPCHRRPKVLHQRLRGGCGCIPAGDEGDDARTHGSGDLSSSRRSAGWVEDRISVRQCRLSGHDAHSTRSNSAFRFSTSDRVFASSAVARASVESHHAGYEWSGRRTQARHRAAAGVCRYARRQDQDQARRVGPC